MNLYSLGQEFAALEEILEEQEGVEGADAEAVDRWFAELEGALEHKLERCVRWIREQEGLAEAARLERDRLADLVRRREARVARLKDAIKALFERLEIKRIDTAVGTVALQANGGKQGVEVLVAPELLPPDCVRMRLDPDLEAIRRTLEAGKRLEGARLKPRGTSIRIR